MSKPKNDTVRVTIEGSPRGVSEMIWHLGVCPSGWEGDERHSVISQVRPATPPTPPAPPAATYDQLLRSTFTPHKPSPRTSPVGGPEDLSESIALGDEEPPGQDGEVSPPNVLRAVPTSVRGGQIWYYVTEEWLKGFDQPGAAQPDRVKLLTVAFAQGGRDMAAFVKASGGLTRALHAVMPQESKVKLRRVAENMTQVGSACGFPFPDWLEYTEEFMQPMYVNTATLEPDLGPLDGVTSEAPLVPEQE